MRHCRSCRWWEAWEDIYPHPLIGSCNRILPFVMTPADEEPPDPDPKMAHVTAGGYLSTGADFGCTLWEQQA